MIKNVLYLGPAGSYSEVAKNKFLSFFADDCNFIQEDSIYKIIRKLTESNSETLGAVIPIENSIEGIVRDTQDNLSVLAKSDIRIQAETSIPIEHSLISYGNKEQIKTILSHPQALAQCREYIYKNWSNSIKTEAVLSTSNAVANLSKDDLSKAAIASTYCANLYNIPIIDSNINDEKNNMTRFILLSKTRPEISKLNKISITFSTENKPGALNQVLNVFEEFGLNMSYIDSRPSRKELGEYIFYVDIIGHVENPNISLALIKAQKYLKNLEILSEGANCS